MRLTKNLAGQSPPKEVQSFWKFFAAIVTIKNEEMLLVLKYKSEVYL